MKLLAKAWLYAFVGAVGFIIGGMSQELVHETGRCSKRSAMCPCEVRAMRRQYIADRDAEISWPRSGDGA